MEFAFEREDRGYTVRAYYLEEPKGEALIEIYKGDLLLKKFTFPSYKIWNIAAHFSDIVDSEIAKNNEGYKIASSDGFGGHAIIREINKKETPTPVGDIKEGE